MKTKRESTTPPAAKTIKLLQVGRLLNTLCSTLTFRLGVHQTQQYEPETPYFFAHCTGSNGSCKEIHYSTFSAFPDRQTKSQVINSLQIEKGKQGASRKP